MRTISRKISLCMTLLMLVMGSADAATEKVYAKLDGAVPRGSSASTWNVETNVFEWQERSNNAITNLSLPTGDITGYEKLVIDCEFLTGDNSQFRILFYKEGDTNNSKILTVDSEGETTFVLSELSDDWKEYLENSSEICLSGSGWGGGKAPDSVKVNYLYLEGPDRGFAYSLDYSSTSEGQFPAGWRTVDGTTIQQYPDTKYSGPRTFVGFTGYQGKGLYWRGSSGTEIGWAVYGMQDDYPLTLEKGKYCLRYAIAAWKNSPAFKVAIAKKNGEEIGDIIVESEVHTAQPAAGGSKTADLSTTQLRQLEFEIPEEGDYVIHFKKNGKDGYDEYLLLACDILDGKLAVTDGEDLNTQFEAYACATYIPSITANKYGTICLPFAPDAASLEAYNFYELTASNIEGTEGSVTFTKVDVPKANKPYIYRLADGAEEGTPITCGATEVSVTPETTIISGWQMVGSFTNQTVDCKDKAIYALNSTGQNLMKVTKTLTVPPYRAYIEGTSSQLDLQMLTVRISGPTGIEQISAADVEGLLPTTSIYDLMGRPVQNPQKGHLYIQGGKKVVY